MNKIIYHGSYVEIECPAIRMHKYTKDFSWGFYCTEIKEQADKWANRLSPSIVSAYNLYDIKSLKVLEFEDYSDEWLDFVVMCRQGGTHDYDVVIGPMADDTIYSYLDAYMSGSMRKDKFFDSMKFRYPTHQISFHTIKALSKLKFSYSYEIEEEANS